MKRMNRFAHSTDDMIKGIGLGDTLDFVVAVSSRLAAMRGVQLESMPPAQEVTVITFPFFLENLLWLCLDYLTKGTGTGGIVRLGSEQKGNRVEIRLTCSGERKGDLPSFPAEGEMALLEALKGTIHVDHQARDILLTLPLDIERNDHLHHS